MKWRLPRAEISRTLLCIRLIYVNVTACTCKIFIHMMPHTNYMLIPTPPQSMCQTSHLSDSTPNIYICLHTHMLQFAINSNQIKQMHLWSTDSPDCIMSANSLPCIMLPVHIYHIYDLCFDNSHISILFLVCFSSHLLRFALTLHILSTKDDTT